MVDFIISIDALKTPDITYNTGARFIDAFITEKLVLQHITTDRKFCIFVTDKSKYVVLEKSYIVRYYEHGDLEYTLPPDYIAILQALITHCSEISYTAVIHVIRAMKEAGTSRLAASKLELIKNIISIPYKLIFLKATYISNNFANYEQTRANQTG